MDKEHHQPRPAASVEQASPEQPASSSSLPPMPPQQLPGVFPPPPNLDEILRAASTTTARTPPSPTSRARRPPMTTERTDERCWTRTSQTNARRALGREPAVTMYCYINMRNALEDLVPVPGHPTAFLARDAPPVDQLPPLKKRSSTVVVDAPEGTPEYRWPWLDGRFVYVARGRENVARHMREMGGVDGEVPPPLPAPAPAPVASAKEGAPATSASPAAAADEAKPSAPHSPTPTSAATAAGRPKRKLMPHAVVVEGERVGAWDTMRRIEERVEKQEADKLLPGKREERMLRRAMGFEDDSSESLISLSDAYSSSLQRLHAHLVRIYSPGLKNLARLPTIWTDGTARDMCDTVTTRLGDGSAFKLVGRMWDSLGSVQQQLEERRRRRSGGGGAGGPGEADPFGGSQPPVGGGAGGAGFPPLPPMPPPAGAPRTAEGEPAASAGGQGAPGAQKKEPWPREQTKVYYTAISMSDLPQQQQQPCYIVINPLAPNALVSSSAGPVLMTHLTPEEQMAEWHTMQAARNAAAGGGGVQAQAGQARPVVPPRSAPKTRSTVPLPPLEPVFATQVPPDQLFGKWAAMYRGYEAQALDEGREEGRARALGQGGREKKDDEEGGEGQARRFKRARYGPDPTFSPHALPSFSSGHILPTHPSSSPVSPQHAQSLELQKAYVEKEQEERAKQAMGARD
ncbi:hypothetical protein JCM9279_003271 [Rhodotorula babjevae]